MPKQPADPRPPVSLWDGKLEIAWDHPANRPLLNLWMKIARRAAAKAAFAQSASGEGER